MPKNCSETEFRVLKVVFEDGSGPIRIATIAEKELGIGI